MSSYEREKKPEQKPPDYLTHQERQMVQRLFGHPEEFPPAFRTWLLDELAVNGQVERYQAPTITGDVSSLQAEIDAVEAATAAHLADTVDAHDASAISNVPAGGIAATTVQAALDELDSEKATAANAVMDGDTAGGVLGGTYPNPSFAADMATQAELDAHVGDTSDAHDASAVSFSPAGTIAATDVQAAIEEVAAEAGGSGGYYAAYAKLWDEKANNVDGGGFTAGADQTRVLNQEYDPAGIVSLSANQFTLQAGTYRIKARAPALQVAAHAAWLYNVSDSAIEVDGAQNFTATAAAQAQTDSVISGEFTIASAKTFEIRHRCQTTKNTNGFGTQATTIAAVSIYTEVELWLLA